MSFVSRSMLAPALAGFNVRSSVYARFDSFWQKGTIDDVEVYHGSMDFWNGSYRSDTKFKRFLIGIGISYDEMTGQSVDGDIERMFFKLNNNYSWDGTVRPSGENSDEDWNQDDQIYEPTSFAEKPSKTEFVNRMNARFNLDDEIEVTIHYGGGLKRYVGSHKLEWSANGIEVISGPLDTEAIRATLESNPWFYFANSRHISTGETFQFQLYNDGTPEIPLEKYNDSGIRPSHRNTPVAAVSMKMDGVDKPVAGGRDYDTMMALVAVLDNGHIWEKQEGIYDEQIETYTTGRNEGEAISYSYTYKYKYVGADEQDKVVQEIDGWYDAYIHQETRNDGSVENMEVFSSSIKDLFSGHMTREETNSLFYNGHLRVKEASIMKRKDFVKMLGKNIDTDYEVEEASWWEKAIAVVLTVIVFVVAFLLTGGVGAFTLAGGGISFSAVGMFCTYVAIGLSIDMMILSAIGGMSMQGIVKIIGAFAQVIGIAGMLAGIGVALQNAGKRLIAEESTTQALKMSATEYSKYTALMLSKQTILDQAVALIKQSVTDVMTSITSFVNEPMANFSMNFVNDGLALVQKGMDYYKEHEEDKLNKELAKKDAEIEELESQTDMDAIPHPAVVMRTMKQWDNIEQLDKKIYEEGPRAEQDKFYASRVTLQC